MAVGVCNGVFKRERGVKHSNCAKMATLWDKRVGMVGGVVSCQSRDHFD